MDGPNIVIPPDVDRSDMDVVIDGQRFIAEARAREQSDALTDALVEVKRSKTTLYEEYHSTLAKVSDLEAEQDRLLSEIQDQADRIAKAQEVLRYDGAIPRETTVQLVSDAGKIFDFTPVSGDEYHLRPDQIETPFPKPKMQQIGESLPPELEPRASDTSIPTKKRRAWLGYIWLVIAGVIGGSAATVYNSDTPTLVETVTETAPGHESGPVAPRLSQTFSWEKVEGATAYQVAFYQAGRLQEGAETVLPEVTIGLFPGEYTWIVYPVIDGVQQPATVNSPITVG